MLTTLGCSVLILGAAIALYFTKKQKISDDDYAKSILKAQENLTKHRDKTKKFPNY